MLQAALILAGCLATASTAQDGNAPAVAAGASAADRVVLRDGRVVLGLITSPEAGPRGGFDMLVRRDWAEAHVEDLAAKWARNAQSVARPAIAQRRERLKAWRRERAGFVPAGDPILSWIDGELTRLEDEKAAAETPLLSVRIARGDCRSVDRATKADGRLLALGWLCGLADVEEKPLGELQDALEARGYALVGEETPSIDRLAPIVQEPEARWLARRAATELSVDSDLRFVRYQGLLLPDVQAGQPLAAAEINPSAILSQINKLFDPGAPQGDPLAPELARIAARGRAGAAVTQLEIAPDLSRVVVEIALWVRGPRGWSVYGTRAHAVRPDQVDPAVGQNIAGDPQVQAAFSLVDKFAPGAVTPEMRQRGLGVGAATSQALGAARSAFNHELDSLALPVLEPPASTFPDPKESTFPDPPVPGIETPAGLPESRPLIE